MLISQVLVFFLVAVLGPLQKSLPLATPKTATDIFHSLTISNKVCYLSKSTGRDSDVFVLHITVSGHSIIYRNEQQIELTADNRWAIDSLTIAQLVTRVQASSSSTRGTTCAPPLRLLLSLLTFKVPCPTKINIRSRLWRCHSVLYYKRNCTLFIYTTIVCNYCTDCLVFWRPGLMFWEWFFKRKTII